MIADALLSSATDEWPTAPEVVEALSAEFGPFTLDPCATPENAKAPRYFTKDDDGLAQSWGGETVYCNPPYGRVIGRWVAKAHEEARASGSRVVLLIPARTDTRYWHDHVMHAERVLFVRGRLRFGEATASAPFPSAVVVFDGAGTAGPPAVSAWEPPSRRVAS